MARYITGQNIWDFHDKFDTLMIATNGIITPAGLVMGKGIALEAKQRFPGLPQMFARAIAKRMTPRGVYGTAYVPELRLGAFQTKVHYKDPSVPELVWFSCQCLLQDLPLLGTVAMPYPGVGHGGLSKECVKSFLDELPDSVSVFSY